MVAALAREPGAVEAAGQPHLELLHPELGQLQLRPETAVRAPRRAPLSPRVYSSYALAFDSPTNSPSVMASNTSPTGTGASVALTQTSNVSQPSYTGAFYDRARLGSAVSRSITTSPQMRRKPR